MRGAAGGVGAAVPAPARARERVAAKGQPGAWQGSSRPGRVAPINRVIPASYCKHFANIKAPVSGLHHKSRCFIGSGKHQRRIKAEALILWRLCAGWIKHTFQILLQSFKPGGKKRLESLTTVPLFISWNKADALCILGMH